VKLKFEEIQNEMKLANKAHEQALLAVRDDATANLERTTQELSNNMEAMMEQKLSLAKENHQREA
jgi:hypothetical protein